jgi:hypothetical protein
MEVTWYQRLFCWQDSLFVCLFPHRILLRVIGNSDFQSYRLVTKDTCALNKILYNFEPRQLSRYSDWLRAGRPRCRSSSPRKVKNFLFSTSSRPTVGPTQPHIQWVPGPLSPGVKRQGREADHSPPTSAEVKKMRIYTSTPPDTFMT